MLPKIAILAAVLPSALACSDVNKLVGFGAGTTGGGSGSGKTVKSCSELESAIDNGGVIKVSGMLNNCGILDVGSDTSIIGVGSNSGFSGGGLRLKKCNNVIIRNLKFNVAPKKGDLLALDRATKVWIDHNEFNSKGLTGGKDDYDGLLDITHASDYVTVSWNTFKDHWKGSLVGHSANNESEDKGHLRVTYHHNHFSNVNSRTPSLRFATAHIYSSCYENIPTSGVNVRETTNAFIENNYFKNVKRAIVTSLDAKKDGFARESGNTFDGSTIEITQSSSFKPPYSYKADSASGACSCVKSKAGTGVVG